jgi:uncharacterized membrane protein
MFTRKQGFKNMSWFILMAAFIVLIFFGGFSLFGYFAGSMFIFYFILGFALLCFFILFVMFIFFRIMERNRKKESAADAIYTTPAQPTAATEPYAYKDKAPSGLFGRNLPNKSIQTTTLESPQSEPIVIYNIQPITKAPPGSKCMISKMDIKPEDDVVQCMNCHSYFIKDYIIEWLKNHENCPVCQTILRMS